MEEWARHLETLARPELIIATLETLPQVLAARAEPPRFDALVGLDILRRLSKDEASAWVQSLKPFAAPGAALVVAEANPARSQGFRELLPTRAVPRDLAAKVESLEAAWRKALPVSPLEALRAQLADAGLDASVIARDYSAKKHFNPSQIRAWFAPQDPERSDSLLGRLAVELSVRERSVLEGALLDVFSGSGIEWRQSYDFLIVGLG